MRHDNIHNIITWSCQLDLCKIMNQVVIAAMCVDDDDLFQAITRDLAAGTFKQTEGQIRLNANTTRIVPRFKDLGKYEIGKYNCGLQGGGAIACFTPNEHVSRKRQMVSVPFDAGQRQQANTLCFLNCLWKKITS